MRIDQILETSRPVLLVRVLPAEDRRGPAQPRSRRSPSCKKDSPDYVSVTYGAGGSTRERTVEVTKWIKEELGIEAMAHFSCVGEPVERLREILDEMREAGIENVLALRGDPPRGETEWKPHPGRARSTRSS